MKKLENVKTWIKDHELELEIAGGLAVGFAIGWFLGRKGVKAEDVIKWVRSPLRGRRGKRALRPSGIWHVPTSASLYVSPSLPQGSEGGVAKAATEIYQSSIPLLLRTPAPKMPFDVSQHVRNLPAGWNASPVKIAEAAAMGIMLRPGQTLVDAYQKGLRIA